MDFHSLLCEIHFQLNRLWFHDFAHLDFALELQWKMSLDTLPPSMAAPGQWGVQPSPAQPGNYNLPALTYTASAPPGKGCTAVVGPGTRDLRNYLHTNVNDKNIFLIFKKPKGICKSCRSICPVCSQTESILGSKQNVFTCWQHVWVQQQCVQRPLSTHSATLQRWAAFLAKHLGAGVVFSLT